MNYGDSSMRYSGECLPNMISTGNSEALAGVNLMSNPGILGIHHVTAIASDPQKNLDFYTGLLGLRLVKLTVNFDDPTTYHFYFGDSQGRPGTILTFFPWPNGARGQIGNGQTTSVSFAVPQTSLAYWSERLKSHQLLLEQAAAFPGDEGIAFSDPDGMRVNLIAVSSGDAAGVWNGSGVPQEHAMRHLHSVTLQEERQERTANLLTETLGFRLIGEKENLFEIATDPPGFATDETPESLGTKLMLPAQYEVYRAGIERTVTPLRLPSQG